MCDRSNSLVCNPLCFVFYVLQLNNVEQCCQLGSFPAQLGCFFHCVVGRDAQSRIIAYSRIILKFISESRILNPILEFSTRFFLVLFLLKISLMKITAVKNCNEEH